MKYVNYIILLLLLSTAFLLKDTLSLSTNLLSLFAPKEAVEKLNIATELGYTRELLIAVKGFDKSSQEKMEAIVTELKTIGSIKHIQYKSTPSKDIQKYYKNNLLLLSKFDDSKQDTRSVHKKLQELKKNQMGGLFYTPIDKNDPLQLFKLKDINTNLSSKGKYIALGGYGYLINVTTEVSPSQMNEARSLYYEIKKITGKYQEVIAFSGFFYTVENSTKIKEDVVFIAILSVFILLFVYIVVLKNIKLFTHTLVALLTSTLFATLVSFLRFDNLHVISLAFGMSITAVSIDYLFHYYFHDFYSKEKKIDKNVLYGFLTTLSAFAVFSFVPVTLIAQISFFTLCSLTFSYLLFTFVFKSLDLKGYEEQTQTTQIVQAKKGISPFIVLSFSLFLLAYSFLNIKLDKNIRNLDYDNKELGLIENTFKDSMGSELSPMIVQAATSEELISRLSILDANQADTFSLSSFVIDKNECLRRKNTLTHYDFSELNILLNSEAKKLGYKENYFQSAYKFNVESLSCNIPPLEMFESYKLSTLKRDNGIYTIAFVSNPQKAIKHDFVSSLNVKDMFSKVSEKMYEDIAQYSFFVLIVVLFLLFLGTKKKFFYALNYILFPFSVTLALLVTLYDINIMHIFASIILIAIGIDYGIYMSNTQKIHRTMMAVRYSLLSTFGAFGVLVFSSITALHSIGLVISLGVLFIYFLMRIMK